MSEFTQNNRYFFKTSDVKGQVPTKVELQVNKVMINLADRKTFTLDDNGEIVSSRIIESDLKRLSSSMATAIGDITYIDLESIPDKTIIKHNGVSDICKVGDELELPYARKCTVVEVIDPNTILVKGNLSSQVIPKGNISNFSDTKPTPPIPKDINAVKNRFDNPAPTSLFTLGVTDSITYTLSQADTASDLERFGDLHATVLSANTTSYGLTSSVNITPEDLASIGVIPSDETPPTVSMKASMYKDLITDTGSSRSTQIWFLLKYDADLTPSYASENNVRLFSGIGQFLGDGNELFKHESEAVDDINSFGYLAKGVKIPATLNGKSFSGITIVFFGHSDSMMEQQYAYGNLAVIKGDEIDYEHSYRNHADSEYFKVSNSDIVELKHLSPEILAMFGSSEKETITIQNSEKILMLGDSYTASHYTMRDKAYISNLANASDWRFENFSISGNDMMEINERLVNNTSMAADVVKPSEIGFTYGLIISYANDGQYLNSGAKLNGYLDNVHRLSKTVQSYGAKPIHASEWMGKFSDSLAMSIFDRQHDIPFWDVFNDSDVLQGTRFSEYWGNSHPAVRTNSLMFGEINRNVALLPRPMKGIKVLRPRDTSANISALRYHDVKTRNKVWREISVNHAALKYPENYDLLASGDRSAAYISSEYLELQAGSSVNFENHALIEFILPATSVSMKELVLSIAVADGPIFLQTQKPTLSFTVDSSSVSTNADYLSEVGKPKSDWIELAITDGKCTVPASLFKEVIDYDKVSVVIARAGTFSIAGVSATIDYDSAKNVTDKPKLVKNTSGLFGHGAVGVDGALTNWRVGGQVDMVIPDDGDSTKIASKVAVLKPGNSLGFEVLPDAKPHVKYVDAVLEIWARYNPPQFDGNDYPNSSLITESSYDAVTMDLVLRSSGNEFKISEEVTLGWRRYQIPIVVSTNAALDRATRVTMSVVDREIEIAYGNIYYS